METIIKTIEARLQQIQNDLPAHQTQLRAAKANFDVLESAVNAMIREKDSLLSELADLKRRNN